MATVQKSKNGNITVIFNDGTKAEFAKPTDTHLGLALVGIRKDPFGMVDVIVDNCLLIGDKDELKTDLGYCKQLSDVMDDLFGKVKAVLEFDLLQGEPVSLVTFEDGVSVMLRKCDRTTYSTSRVKSSNNPLTGLKYILKECVLPDDGLDPSFYSNPSYLLGFSEIVEQYLEDTGKRLGN